LQNHPSLSCEKACFEAVIESCNDIIVRANFPADYSLYWLLSKPGSANIYQRRTTTNGSGDLIIPKASLPAGYLIKGGFYNIQIKDGDDYLQPVTFVFGTAQYTCINAQLVNFNREEEDNSEVNVIEFKEAIVPGDAPSGAEAIVYAFANQTSFIYNHNLGRVVDVTIYNLAGEIIIATVTDDTVNHNYITVTFTSSTSGRLLIQ
jgi:hypothetical protein